MSTLVLIGLVLVVAGVVILVVQLMPRRKRTVAATAAQTPKTVADLVRLRSGPDQGIGAQAAPASAPPTAAPATPAPAAAVPATVAVAPSKPSPAPRRDAASVMVAEPRVAPTTEPLARPLPLVPAAIAGTEAGAAPAMAPMRAPDLDLNSDDTPWRRAAVMAAGGEIAIDAWQAPVLAEPVPLRLVPPAGGAAGGWTGWADWDAVDAEVEADDRAADRPARDTAPGTTDPAPAPGVAASDALALVLPVAGVVAAGLAATGQGTDHTRASDTPTDTVNGQTAVPGLAEAGTTEPAPEPAAPSAVIEPAAFEPAASDAAPQNAHVAGSEPGTLSELVPVFATAPAVAAPPPAPEDEPELAAAQQAAAPAPADDAPASGALGRRTPDERAAEQAAADLALVRTFGFADPGLRPDAAPVVSMGRPGEAAPAASGGSAPSGSGQPVRFRAVRRDGAPVGGVAAALLDDRGREVAAADADADGCGEVPAPAPGAYVLVSTAPGHQPGAVAVTVRGEPAEAEVLLARSASVSGVVHGEDGPIARARVTLVQDGEIVDTIDTDDDGAYRIGDIGAGEYGLSVAAAGCEPNAVLVEVADEADLRRVVELRPASPTADHDGGFGPDSLDDDGDDPLGPTPEGLAPVGYGPADDDVVSGHR